MPLFTITAHLEFPTKGEPITSGTIRFQIPADTKEQAREKAQQFLEGRMQAKIDNCAPSPSPEVEEELAKILGQFGNLFK